MYRVAAAAVFGSLVASAMGQEGETPDPLFQDNATLQVTMTAPFKTLVRERSKDDYLPGMFQYTEADGTTVKLDLEIRTRGNFRHKNCKYPPPGLNLKKSQTRGTLFDKQNKLKLVIPCEYSAKYEQAILREYLAYRILNALTNMSFRVRLLRITYVNTEVKKSSEVRYGFLIEHKKRLAKRYELKELEVERMKVASIQPDQLNLTSLFQFLIGNTDFSPIAGAPGDQCCHNYVLFGNDIDPVIAIPYDFDQSGFVNAPYAAPDPRFSIRTVRQRLYRGRCVNNEYIPASLRRFRDRRDSIYALVKEQEGLESAVRDKLLRYIDDFYELIDDSRDVERRIAKRCI